MISQMKKIEKKKPGPKPTGKGELIAVRLQPELLGAVDRHQEATGAASRPEAIRLILTEFLKRRGLL
jgi:hypothetical protein